MSLQDTAQLPHDTVHLPHVTVRLPHVTAHLPHVIAHLPHDAAHLIHFIAHLTPHPIRPPSGNMCGVVFYAYAHSCAAPQLAVGFI